MPAFRNTCTRLADSRLGCSIVSMPLRFIPGLLAAALAVATLSACGSSSSSSDGITALASADTVAQVGSYPITEQLLNEWMTVDLGTDYYEIAKRRVPAQLVSEPPNYPACVAALNAPLRGKGAAKPQPTAEQLNSKCEQLYQAIKAETLTFLVGSYWNINFDAAHGVSVTNAEVQRSLEQVRAKKYPKPAQFQESLYARRRSLAQELFVAKISLLQQKLLQKLQSKEARYANLYKEVRRAVDSATCRAEDVVQHCRQFNGHVYSHRLLTALLHEITR
jgi:hypothetical protein